jgi:hypothetical protein
MTAQVPDAVELEGRSYVLVGITGGPLFEPEAVGLVPMMMSTGCWRGYVATYRVVGDRLTLGELVVGKGSTVDGQEVTAGAPLFGHAPEEASMGLAYRGLAVDVPFTGGLLLGQGFISSLYTHMGFAPGWKFETLVELKLTAGVVDSVQDRSADAARMRQQIREGAVDEPDGPPGGPGWIERTFRRGYKRTFGG